MIGIVPIVFVEEAEEVALAEKGRRSVYAMAIESILPSGIWQFDYVDFELADCGFDFCRCLRVVDYDQVLDRLVTLNGNTFDCAQDARIAGRGSDNGDEWLGHFKIRHRSE
jgi:hypothetical protein